MTAAPHILLVEDNPATLKMLTVTLQTEDYAVTTAIDGRTAIAAVAGAIPDLILQDLVLPDMDGADLVRILRGMVGAEVPIVALSGMVHRLEDPRTLEAGFTSVLVKPVEPEALLEAIRAYLPHDEVTVIPGERRRLLLVDDDFLQLKLTRVQLSRLGFEVTAVSSVAEAMSAAGAQHPDIIVSDVFMPDRDGFHLCLDIRHDPALADIPIVLMSAQYVSDANQEMARRVGASALVLRTPGLEQAVPALLAALQIGAAAPSDQPSEESQLKHALQVIRQLERQLTAAGGLARRCAFQASQLALLSGVADALTSHADIDVALGDVLAGTLDAVGISKGALFLGSGSGLRLRHGIGFSESERGGLESFFGRLDWLADLVQRGAAATIPSLALAADDAQAILEGAGIASAHIVPLMSSTRSVGAMVVGGSRIDLTHDDLVGLAKAIGSQVVQSIELTEVVARLAAAEQWYRTLLRHASDAIATMTPAGVLRGVNLRWEEILGRPESDLIGHHIGEFAAAVAADGQVPDSDGRPATADGRVVPSAIARGDGSVAWMEVSESVVDIGGEEVILAIGRDVTERRRLEVQLRQAQKLEAIGRLAGGVAHDFNNVLTAILGFCGILISDAEPGSPQYAALTEIQKAGNRAAGLTHQLLAFSRHQILQPKTLSINQLVQDVEQMLLRLIPEDIELRLSLHANAGLIEIDAVQFEQILVNLVVNARDAMPRGGTLTVETAAMAIDSDEPLPDLPANARGYVCLTVRDTGTGMDAATRQRIFEPFFTTKGPGKGTGLRLATVYGIVKQSGGELAVHSEVGRGSTFTIYLPRPADHRVSMPVATASRLEMPPRGSETVLLVEDDESVRRLTSTALQQLGYTVLEATNPVEALRVAHEYARPLDLLLSDVIMPESTGAPLIGRLAPTNRGLRVLYMSGYTDETIVDQGVLVSGTAFLPKPFTLSALGRKVRDVLDHAIPQA